ncbi:SOS response-associated peptidase [Actinoplanes sp. URMC 104]|uniref:SOS response-associated peptidase n=1 Tax=Actinoplanes sp. URMC 104 TaxID=3423409 RepID=UPI003F1DAF74
MCGRYASSARRPDLQQLYHADGPGDGVELAPSWNVAPTTKVYTVVQRHDGDRDVREVRAMRWGLVPFWFKPGTDPKTGKAKRMPSLHNARADRLATAPSWRGPFARHRAIIPATGYYEWLTGQDADGNAYKQPYYVHPAGGMLSFAGLYEKWADPDKDADDPDRWLWSAAIITHHATWLAGEMNERTPVILPPERIDAWLDPALTDKQAAHELITGIDYAPLQVRAVSTAVNKTGRGAARGPELIEPVDEQGDTVLQLQPA